VTVLYNAMLAPLTPFPIKGVIWYQGEANVGREKQYRELFPAMIAGWRKAWGIGNFPFLFVQIAPHEGMSPEIREAQLMTLKRAERSAMAVTVDVGDAKDIHPVNKAPVGARLVSTVSVAELLSTDPLALLTSTRNIAPLSAAVVVNV